MFVVACVCTSAGAIEQVNSASLGFNLQCNFAEQAMLALGGVLVFLGHAGKFCRSLEQLNVSSW